MMCLRVMRKAKHHSMQGSQPSCLMHNWGSDTAGCTRATLELHGAVRSGAAGCGSNRDHWPPAGHESYASTHAHLGTGGRETHRGPPAASRPEEQLDSELPHGC
jgi:hypothetical protein